MAVLVKLTNGEIEVTKDLEAFTALLHQAREQGRLLEFTDDAGDGVVIVPEHVVYVTDKTAPATPNGRPQNGRRHLQPAEPAAPHRP